VGEAQVPTTGYAVLGLLSFGRELSGYDLKKWADSSLRFFYWSPAISQIYSELRRLEGLGFVTSRPAPQDELRNKRLYRITETGLAALTEWVADAPFEPPVLKHPAMLRVWLGHLVEPADLRPLVEAQRDHAEQMLADMRRAELGSVAEPAWRYPEKVIRWGERYYEAERDAAVALLAEMGRHEEQDQPETKV
jgi:DNA-binding PadR family transcriptional regulator